MTDDHIRDRIIARADELGMSAYAIARQAGIDPGTISRYFRGRLSLSSRHIAKVCDVLGLELRTKK